MTEPGSVPDAGGDREEGISKYIKRMRTVLRSKSNRGSVSSMGEILGESSKAGAKPTTSSSVPKPISPAPKPTPDTAQKTPTAVSPAQIQYWNNQRQEKVRALFAKYGLTLEPDEWLSKPTNTNIQRMEKPIRMRIRRNCHRCLTVFGADKLCSNCNHTRCKKCFRYPPSKSKATAKGKEKAVPPAPGPQQTPRRSRPVLTIPSRTGGQDRVRRPIKMRIRRTCHRCSTLFDGNATVCEGCSHVRCKKCPRDPPKLNKWPDGYPGDAEPPVERQERVWRRPRRRIRWTCHTCNKLFSHGDRICTQCSHERCKDCIRDPPKKIKPEPDPDLLRRVEERLAALEVS